MTSGVYPAGDAVLQHGDPSVSGMHAQTLDLGKVLELTGYAGEFFGARVEREHPGVMQNDRVAMPCRCRPAVRGCFAAARPSRCARSPGALMLLPDGCTGSGPPAMIWVWIRGDLLMDAAYLPDLGVVGSVLL